jgi:hypothetical protein
MYKNITKKIKKYSKNTPMYKVFQEGNLRKWWNKWLAFSPKNQS